MEAQPIAAIFRNSVAGPPFTKNKANKPFEFKPVVDIATGDITRHQLCTGSKKHPVGVLAFKAHKGYKTPASVDISIHGGQWLLSFNYDDCAPDPSDK